MTAYMVSQILLQKSSAKHLAPRRISQKCFVDLDYGHHRCPFLKTFSSLVQIRIEEITKLIYVIRDKKEEHNGLPKIQPTKSDFLGPNIMTWDTPQNAYFVFY